MRKISTAISIGIFIVLSILLIPQILDGNRIILIAYILFSLGLLKDIFLYWREEKN